MRRVEWVVVKSYFVKHKLVRREIYGHSNKVRDCHKMIRGYKSIIMNREEPFFKNTKEVRGIYNRAGLDVKADHRLIEFRIHPINIFMV